MRFASVTQRLRTLGGAKWAVHLKARDLAAAGHDIIELTIGEPDVPVAPELEEAAILAIQAGRTAYSSGQGELGLRQALADDYSARTGRAMGPEHFLCVPGTQTALFTAVMGVAEAGDEVLVGDPMYATYEGVIRASGAEMVSVPLTPQCGFRMQARDVAARITPRARAILLNTPHNPTGAVSTLDELRALGELAQAHDLWIISDEVYADLIFSDQTFVSPFDIGDLKERVIVVSSISKSHAAPGFRSGWIAASPSFVETVLPLSEAMLFGNQPFIADMTETALRNGSTVAAGMRKRFSARADRLAALTEQTSALRVLRPEAGMFAMVDVAGTGLTGDQFAEALLDRTGVAVMPGSSFGEELATWVRLALTVEDHLFDEALRRIVDFCRAEAA